MTGALTIAESLPGMPDFPVAKHVRGWEKLFILRLFSIEDVIRYLRIRHGTDGCRQRRHLTAGAEERVVWPTIPVDQSLRHCGGRVSNPKHN